MPCRLWIQQSAWALLAVGASFVFLNTAQADAPPWGKQFAAMFDAGWRHGSEAQVAAEDHYRAVQKAAGNDSRVELGWALVLIKQRRTDAALEQLERILKQNPDDLTAMTWKARLQLHNKKFPEAIVALERLADGTAQALAADADAARRADGLAAARFLGRAVGFLEGPAQYNAGQVASLSSMVQEKLGEDGKKNFEATRAAVLDDFGKLQRQGEQHQADDRQKEEEEKKQLQEQVETRSADLERELSDIAAERNQIRSDQRKELADISREARQADSATSQAESRLAAVLRQWNLWQNERIRLLALMDAEEDEARRQLWRNEVARLDISLGNVDAERRLREADVLRARARRAEVERSRLEVARRYETTLAGMNKREDSARREQRSLANKQKQIDKPVSAISSRQRNLMARATVFATYDENPLDIEKARLLASVR